LIGAQNVTDLLVGENATLAFTMNLLVFAANTTFTVKANATVLDGVDTNLGNNEKVDGQLKIRFWGDVNSDDVINILDLKLVKLAYSALIDEPFADLDGNCVVNILDVKLMKLIYSGLLSPWGP